MSTVGDRLAVVDRIRDLLQQGAPWAASDVFRDGIAAHPHDGELLYWGALASARSGAIHEARTLLDRARAAGGLSPDLLSESLCLGGRLAKDEADRGPGQALDSACAFRARADYLQAYALSGDSYPGVNAATLSMLLGDRAASRAMATEIAQRLNAQPRLTTWEQAALGEVHLLLGRPAEARRHYADACAQSPGSGSVASMRRQIKLLQRVLPDAQAVLDVLPATGVVAFAGHLADRPGQAARRFPQELEAAVATALRERLQALDHPVVYTSAACGADLLFIEAALERGAEVNVVLPFARAEFVRTSVAVGGDRWIERFDRALDRANRVILATTEAYLGDDVLFEHALHLIEGLSVLRASQLESDAALLCVLDYDSPPLSGGTRAAYDRWIGRRGLPDVVDLRTLRRDAGLAIDGTVVADAGAVAGVPTAPDADARPERTLKVMLFADIAGFGRMHDAFAPLFHARFLRLVADSIAASANPPLEANTWGDALYVVFESPADGAEFALGLTERAEAVDWVAAGLSESSRIRIALHTGPVFCGFDPIIGRDNYFGSSVTQTARIEPVTPPGLVYASEAFAATLASLDDSRYRFEYMGNLELAKGYGDSRIYRLERL